MAPTKLSAKRGQQQQLQPSKAAKKPRSDPMLAAVSDTIEKASELPETCRSMLLAVLPACFGAGSDMRSAAQARFVSMIGEAVEDIQASMQQAVNTADTSIAEIERSKVGLEGKAAEAEAAGAASTDAATAKKSALAEATKAATAAKEALTGAQIAQREGETALLSSQAEKEAIDTAIEVDLKALTAGDLEAESAKKHTDVMLKLANGAGLDSSLVTSIPSACSKPLASRGTFDLMVMEQLEKSLKEKVVELTAKLASGAEEKAAHTARVEAAQTAFDAAHKAKLGAADEFRASQASVSEAEAVLKAAKDMVANVEPSLKRAIEERAEKQGALELFVSWDVACFTTLRDKSSKTVEKVADLELAAPEAAAVAKCGA